MAQQLGPVQTQRHYNPSGAPVSPFGQFMNGLGGGVQGYGKYVQDQQSKIATLLPYLAQQKMLEPVSGDGKADIDYAGLKFNVTNVPRGKEALDALLTQTQIAKNQWSMGPEAYQRSLYGNFISGASRGVGDQVTLNALHGGNIDQENMSQMAPQLTQIGSQLTGYNPNGYSRQGGYAPQSGSPVGAQSGGVAGVLAQAKAGIANGTYTKAQLRGYLTELSKNPQTKGQLTPAVIATIMAEV